MAKYLTEFVDIQDCRKYAGCYIEAASLEEAQLQAVKISVMEFMMENPRFIWLSVVGKFYESVQWNNEHAHAVAEMICDRCDHPWTAVYPADAWFLDCPKCGHQNRSPEGFN